MQNKFSYKTMALFMAFLMFSSSIGFSMDVHFCENQIESVNFFGDAEPCEMMQESMKGHSCCEAPKKEIKSCHNKEMAKDNCCHNESFSLSNSGELETSSFSLVQFQQVITAIIVLFPNINVLKTLRKKANYAYYKPPPIIKDISILIQVFRI